MLPILSRLRLVTLPITLDGLLVFRSHVCGQVFLHFGNLPLISEQYMYRYNPKYKSIIYLSKLLMRKQNTPGALHAAYGLYPSLCH
jgi:hypothetical protein